MEIVEKVKSKMKVGNRLMKVETKLEGLVVFSNRESIIVKGNRLFFGFILQIIVCEL